MNKSDLIERTRGFALEVIGLAEGIPHTQINDIMIRQLIRAATSVGANYRAACRARSKPEFIAKMGIVEEEADECKYWIELLLGSQRIAPGKAQAIMREADALLAITIRSIKTAKSNRVSR